LSAKLLLESFIVSSQAIFLRVISQDPREFKRGRRGHEAAHDHIEELQMKAYAIGTALLGAALFAAIPASAQDRNVATVVRLFVEQSPGLLAEERIARADGQRWAEIRRVGAEGKSPTELVRIPAGMTVRAGDRMFVAAPGGLSASAGAGAPSRLPMEPQLERPLDFTAQGLRTPVTRPLEVVPGSCVPFQNPGLEIR
jgi:hypothetical protein